MPDLLIAAVLAALVGLPVLAQRREARAQAQTQEAATAALARPHLEAAHDLAPYVPLQAADVVARGDPIADAEALAANAVGHYPTSRIEKARPLDPSRLSKRRIAFAAFFLLRVTLKLKPAFDVSSFPVAVSLLLSARGGPAGVVLNGELLDLASDGVTAIVAIPEADVSDVARFLGEADVYLAVRVP